MEMESPTLTLLGIFKDSLDLNERTFNNLSESLRKFPDLPTNRNGDFIKLSTKKMAENCAKMKDFMKHGNAAKNALFLNDFTKQCILEALRSRQQIANYCLEIKGQDISDVETSLTQIERTLTWLFKTCEKIGASINEKITEEELKSLIGMDEYSKNVSREAQDFQLSNNIRETQMCIADAQKNMNQPRTSNSPPSIETEPPRMQVEPLGVSSIDCRTADTTLAVKLASLSNCLIDAPPPRMPVDPIGIPNADCRTAGQQPSTLSIQTTRVASPSEISIDVTTPRIPVDPTGIPKTDRPIAHQPLLTTSVVTKNDVSSSEVLIDETPSRMPVDPTGKPRVDRQTDGQQPSTLPIQTTRVASPSEVLIEARPSRMQVNSTESPETDSHNNDTTTAVTTQRIPAPKRSSNSGISNSRAPKKARRSLTFNSRTAQRNRKRPRSQQAVNGSRRRRRNVSITLIPHIMTDVLRANNHQEEPCDIDQLAEDQLKTLNEAMALLEANYATILKIPMSEEIKKKTKTMILLNPEGRTFEKLLLELGSSLFEEASEKEVRRYDSCTEFNEADFDMHKIHLMKTDDELGFKSPRFTFENLQDELGNEEMKKIRTFIIANEERVINVSIDTMLDERSRRDSSQSHALLNLLSFNVNESENIAEKFEIPNFVKENSIMAKIQKRLSDIENGLGKKGEKLTAALCNIRNKLPDLSCYLMLSMAGSVIAMHVDSSGSGVNYHVLVGEKVFYVAPPGKNYENISLYEKFLRIKKGTNKVWFLAAHANIFKRVVVKAGESIFMPPGWLHSVHTTMDSIVVGGNYLLEDSLELSIRLTKLEEEICAREDDTIVKSELFENFWWVLFAYCDLIFNDKLKEAKANNDDSLKKKAELLFKVITRPELLHKKAFWYHTTRRYEVVEKFEEQSGLERDVINNVEIEMEE